MGSQAPNVMSSRSASGTNSRINGDRFSVRFPRRMVAICVSDPMGLDNPRRTLSTPAMKVVATAPRPGVRTPRRPVAGRTVLRALLELPVLPVLDPCTSELSWSGSTRGSFAERGTRAVLVTRNRLLRLIRCETRRLRHRLQLLQRQVFGGVVDEHDALD